jgi:hypothetical protein
MSGLRVAQDARLDRGNDGPGSRDREALAALAVRSTGPPGVQEIDLGVECVDPLNQEVRINACRARKKRRSEAG